MVGGPAVLGRSSTVGVGVLAGLGSPVSSLTPLTQTP